MPIVHDFANRTVVLAVAQEPLLDVATRMRAQRVGTAVLVEEDANGHWTPRGVITDRDIVAQALCDPTVDLESVPAGRAATGDLEVALEGEDLMKAIARMRQCRLTNIPVVDDNGTLTGILRLETLFDYFELLTGALELLLSKDSRPGETVPPS